MFKIEKNTISYSWFPKLWQRWREDFIAAANRVASDYNLVVTIKENGKNTISAVYASTNKQTFAGFSEKATPEIQQRYFPDYH